MQNFSRVCTIADHDQMNIIYVCSYSNCQLNRFMCPNCILDGTHKHFFSENKHILDQKRFCDKIKSKISQIKDQLVLNKQAIESIGSLKQLIQEIYNSLKMISNFISKFESDISKDGNIAQEELENIQINGFNNIDSQQLDNLINKYDQLQKPDLYLQLQEQSDIIIQVAKKINDWRLSLIDNSQLYEQKIKDANIQITEIENIKDTTTKYHYGTISNDQNFIVSGDDNYELKIWNYENYTLVKSIQLEYRANICKFTDDSTFLYVGTYPYLYQFHVKNQFNKTLEVIIHDNNITDICFISNTIILTTSYDKTIIKTDIDKKQQIFKIQAHEERIYGLDYNRKFNIIVSGSEDKSIKLWNGHDGSQLIEKQNANNYCINQVLFIINTNKLISTSNIDIQVWNINYQTNQFEQQLQIKLECFKTISFQQDLKLIIISDPREIKIYSITGELIRTQDINQNEQTTTNQMKSMRAVLLVYQKQLQVCKIYLE